MFKSFKVAIEALERAFDSLLMLYPIFLGSLVGGIVAAVMFLIISAL